MVAQRAAARGRFAAALGASCGLLLLGCGQQPASTTHADRVSEVSACDKGTPPPPGGGITQARAREIASGEARGISGPGVRFMSVCVTSLRAALPGVGPGAGEPLAALVWNFRFGGEFGAVSCGPVPLPGQPAPTCPPPQDELQVLLDYHSGRFVEMGTPPELSGLGALP